MIESPMEAKFLERLNSLFDNDPRTDTAIGDALGVSKQTVSYWRQGTRSPKRKTIQKIAEMYQVSPVWLMGFGEEKASVMTELLPEELRLLNAYRNAEKSARGIALEILENHPKGER